MKKYVLVFIFLAFIITGFLTFSWKKPEYEIFLKNYTESLIKEANIPLKIQIDKVKFSLIHVRFEIEKVNIFSKIKDQKGKAFFEKIFIYPSLIDLFFWKNIY